MPPATPKTDKPPIVLVKFETWYNGYRAGETAGFSPEDATRLCDVEKVAERYLTEEQRGKAEAAARKAQEAAEKEAQKAAAEAEAKAKAEEEAAAKAEADAKKARGGA